MSGSDTHADTPERDWSQPLTSDERARIAQQIIAGAGSGWLGFLYKTYEASERERDRERARADRAEYLLGRASMRLLSLSEEIEDALLSAGSGGRETTP